MAVSVPCGESTLVSSFALLLLSSPALISWSCGALLSFRSVLWSKLSWDSPAWGKLSWVCLLTCHDNFGFKFTTSSLLSFWVSLLPPSILPIFLQRNMEIDIWYKAKKKKKGCFQLHIQKLLQCMRDAVFYFSFYQYRKTAIFLSMADDARIASSFPINLGDSHFPQFFGVVIQWEMTQRFHEA